MNMNYTEGINVTGTSQINPLTNQTEYIYNFDLGLITIILLIIMLCQLAQTFILFTKLRRY